MMKRSMNSRHRQKGMSSFGWIAVFGIFALLLVLLLKVFPMYYGNYQLKSALETLVVDDRLNPKSKKEIWQSLERRLLINEVRSIKRDDVTMKRKDGKTTVTVDYEVRNSFIGPLFIGAHFVEVAVIDR